MRTVLAAGFTAAALFGASIGARAQSAAPAPDSAASQTAPAATPGAGQPQATINLTNQKPSKTRKQDKVVESKDTKKEDKKVKKDNQLEGIDPKLPDKELYDKAQDAMKHGRYDVARLDLQTLLNTYQDSQFQMRAKLAIADSWYKEGGTAALTQAEQEYKDFITFFPNAPEAAEAQMRVGDIYFRQMDKPDRDNSNTVKAEQEYRLMLQEFPESPLIPTATQKLREVQETLAYRESDVASFYASRLNYAAAIARYQTVADSYPLYSQMDEVLLGLGDAYEAQARYFRGLKLPEAAKARLVKLYDGEAADAYRKVILEHSAAAHVEDARDRLVGMGLPVPTPTPAQVAASEALENSRGQYTLGKRAIALFAHQADTVPAATIGAPPLEDAKPTLAPTIYRQAFNDYTSAFNPAAAAAQPANAAAAPANAAADAPAATAPAANAPLELQNVPTSNAGGSSSPVDTSVTSGQTSSPAATSGGNTMGIEIVQPSGAQTPVTAPASPPAFPGTANPATPAQANGDNGGLTPVGPTNTTVMAPIEKPTVAPDAVNEVTPGTQPPAQAAPANGKKPKVDCDKSDESCSRHKKKKGIAKLNPF
jgi:outer membrane protein assembly factor BamD